MILLKKIVFILKRIIVASVLLYAYNRFAVSFNATVPINFITIGFVSIFGIPVIIAFVIFNYFVF